MGEDKLDISSVQRDEARSSGYNPDKGVTFVRNPNSRTDSANPDIRGQLPGRHPDRDRLEPGRHLRRRSRPATLDGSYGDTPPSTVEQQYATDPNLKSSATLGRGGPDVVLSPEPVHPAVRRYPCPQAVNTSWTRRRLAKAFGGSLHGVPATAIEPPTVNPATADLRTLYHAATTSPATSTQALAEMKQSKLRAPTVPASAPTLRARASSSSAGSTSPWPNMDQVVMTDLAKIGLTPKLSEVDTDHGLHHAAARGQEARPALARSRAGVRTSLTPSDSTSSSWTAPGSGLHHRHQLRLVGFTAAQAKECGIEVAVQRRTSKYGPIPSVDDAINTCEARARSRPGQSVLRAPRSTRR